MLDLKDSFSKKQLLVGKITNGEYFKLVAIFSNNEALWKKGSVSLCTL
jgi:hypothetical protein